MPDKIYMRYAVASAGALTCDMAIFWGAISVAVNPVLAAVLGYGTGVAAHWFLSSRFVFPDGNRMQGAQRHVQKALFVLSSLIGAGVVAGVVAAGTALGLAPTIAKLAAIIVSFHVTFIFRRILVFPT